LEAFGLPPSLSYIFKDATGVQVFVPLKVGSLQMTEWRAGRETQMGGRIPKVS